MFSSAEEVLRFIAEENVEFIDVRFCDLPGTMQHFTVPRRVVRRGRLHRRPHVRRLVDPRVPGDPRVGHAAAARPDDRRARPVPHAQDAEPDVLRARPADRRALHQGSAQHRPQGARTTCAAPASATPRTSARRRSSTSSTRPASRPRANEGYYYIDSVEGAWNSGLDEDGGNLAYKPRYKGGYFPVPPMDHFADLRAEMVDQPASTAGIQVEMQHHEVGTAGPGRDQHAVRLPAAGGRQADAVQVRHQVHRPGGGQDRDVHAQAAVRRQRQRHALPPVASGRTARRCSTTRSATPACPTSAGTTSAACSSTRPRCWRSPTRR